MKKLFLILLTFPFLLPFLSFNTNSKFYSNRNDPNFGIKTIVIDAGHGGKDGSTRGIHVKEKNVALEVSLKLGKAIKASLPDVKVVYTRTEDVFVPLYERIGLANQVKADLFISIHCNAMPSNMKNRSSVRGTETLVSGFKRLGQQDAALRENASILLEKNYKENYDGFDPNDPVSFIVFKFMKNAYRAQSIKFATLIQNEYTNTGRIDRGVKEQSLAVLAKAGMPAVLTEIGFISSPQEEKYISSDDGQNEIVNCLLKAIQTYKKQVEIQ